MPTTPLSYAARQSVATHSNTAKRLSAWKRGYDKAWRANSAYVLAHELVCRKCGRAAEVTDHIIPLSKGGTNERSNLQALCKRCHDIKTASKDGGFGNTHGGSV